MRKGLVLFRIKNFLIIYSPPCHPRYLCLSFFSRKEIKIFAGKHSRIFLHIVDFNGFQQVVGPNCCFSAASKGSTQSQPRNKGLI